MTLSITERSSTLQIDLRDRLILEKSLFQRDVALARIDAINAYNLWAQTGRNRQEYLAKFFEQHHRSIELNDRILWIDKILEETA